MKRNLFIILLLIGVLPVVTYADEVYVNYYGVEFTEDEYSNMLELGFLENEIYYMSEDEFNNIITECKKLSKYDTNIVPKYNDKLITLSTCSYSSENARLVVVARKVDF